MKTFTAALVFVMMVFIGGRMPGQNLVGNGSFEDYYSCPTFSDQVYNCVGWESVETCQGYPTSPDYLNACATGSSVWIPTSAYGYQYAHSGNAYCGVITYGYGVSCLREIIQAHLTSSMIVGNEYNVSMFVALGFSDIVNIATNKIGIRLSTVPFSFTNPPLIDNWANIYSDSVIYDTLNWVPVQASLLADSAYEYILIGNFFDDQNTTHIQVGADHLYAYYYIDDVNVSTDSTATGISNLKSHLFFLSPNPVQNLLTINLHYTLTQPGELMVYDALGRKVKSYTLAASQKTFELSVAELPAGVYLVAVNSGGRVWGEVVVKE